MIMKFHQILSVLFFATNIKGENNNYCGKPGKPEDGFYRDEKENYNIGETVHYECHSERYQIKGNQIRECLRNRTWSGSAPFCDKLINKNCGDPDLPSKGILHRTNQTEGRLSCEKGYHLQGAPLISCVNGLWETSGRYCLKLKDRLECGNPGNPSNGFFHTNNSYSTKNQLIYECDNGFVLVGPKERVCEPNGTWSSTLPKCVRNIAMNKTTKFQRRQNESKPTSNSTDGDQSTCEYIYSDFDSYAYIDFGEISSLDTIHIFFKGMIVDIYVYATNSSNVTIPYFRRYQSLTEIYRARNFRHHPILASPLHLAIPIIETKYLVFWLRKRTPICELIAYNSNEITDCGQPDQPSNGRILRRDWNTSMVTYECDDGYAINGTDNVRCVDGVWENELPLCNPIPPTEPPSTTKSQNKFENENSKINIIIAWVMGGCAALIAIICIFWRYRLKRKKVNEPKNENNKQDVSVYDEIKEIPIYANEDLHSPSCSKDASEHEYHQYMYITTEEPRYA